MGGRLVRRSRAIPGWADPLGLEHPQGTQGVPMPVQDEARVAKAVVVQGQGYSKVPHSESMTVAGAAEVPRGRGAVELRQGRDRALGATRHRGRRLVTRLRLCWGRGGLERGRVISTRDC